MIKEYQGEFLTDGLYYFYAGWSSKCNVLIERLDKISRDFPTLTIYKVNTTKYPGFKKDCSITKIPSYLMFKNQTITGKLEGNVDFLSLHRWISQQRS